MYGIYENNKVIAKFTAPLTLKSNVPVFVSDTLSLKRVINKRPAQRWELETGVEPLSLDSSDLFVNLVSKGFTETVYITMPQNYGARNRLKASSVPVATGTVFSNSVTVVNLNNLLPKGTFIKFSNHSKIYMTLNDLAAPGGTLNIFPNLKTNISDITFIYKDDVIMQCLYDTDNLSGMRYEDGILMDIGSIKLVELL